MEWIKKHIALIIAIVLIVVLVLPLGINALYLISTNCEVLHKPSEWTMFWGSYLGAIISAGVALIILHIQRKENEEQNNSNRDLQINTLKYQLEQSRLDNFMSIASELITAIDPLALKTTCRQLQNDNVRLIEKKILDGINYIRRVRLQFFLYLSESDPQQKSLGEKADKITGEFLDAMEDIQNLLLLISVSDVPMTCQLLKGYAEVVDNDRMSENLKKAILEYQPSKYEGAKIEWEWEGIALALVDLVQENSNDLYKIIDDFVSEERKRIENILTEGI